MKRNGSAIWRGTPKDGHGEVSTGSGTLSSMPYSYTSRFESGKGTNPEELIAAAHAGCFSMALALQLGTSGLTPRSIETAATLSIERIEAGWTITAVHLDVHGDVPGATRDAFEVAATNAKDGCPVSRVLNAKITMSASLIPST